jgi:hypothetical protein
MRFLFLLVGVLACPLANAQVVSWLGVGKVADKTHGNLHPRIQVDKYNNPLVVWGDDAGKVWFARWGGESFTAPVQLNIPGKPTFATSWSGPDIAAKGDTIYVVYKSLPSDTGHIYITHSYDGGTHFSVPDRVDAVADQIARFPVVAADDAGNPFVAFLRSGKGNESAHVVVARSDDLGESFKNEIAGSIAGGGSACECSPAALAVSGQVAMLLYRNNIDSLRNVYASASNNGGLKFLVGLRLDSTAYRPESCPASSPDGVIAQDTLYSVYMGGDPLNTTVYLSKISLSNLSVSVRPLLGDVLGVHMQNFPRIASWGNAVATVWTQTAGGNNQVCMLISDDITEGFRRRVDTIAAGVMLNADIALGRGFVYAVWEDVETRCVMYRKGVYRTRKSAENLTIVINSPPKGQKFFWVNKEGVLSCSLTDVRGSRYEVDVSYPKGNSFCKVDIEDLEPGVYTVRLFDSEGRNFTGRVELR